MAAGLLFPCGHLLNTSDATQAHPESGVRRMVALPTAGRREMPGVSMVSPRGYGGPNRVWQMPSLREIWRTPQPLMPRRLPGVLVRAMLTVFGRDVQAIHGMERLQPELDPFIVVLNHSTRLEALMLPAVFAHFRRGKMISFVADWNFALIPGVATILRAGNTILLVRKPAKPAFLNVFKPWFQRHGPAFEQAEAMLRRGRSVGIFPEGTTNRNPRHLLRGFDGAARLSLVTGRPVVPVGVRFPSHTGDGPIRDRTPMVIQVGEPLSPAAINTSPSREEVRSWHADIMREVGRLSGKTWEPGAARKRHHGQD